MFIKSKKKEILITLLCISVFCACIFLLKISTLTTIKNSYVPIRATKDDTAPLTHLLLKDSQYTTLKYESEWEHVQFNNGQSGWFFKGDLTSSLETQKNVQLVKPIKASVPVFKDSRSTDKELGKLDVGTVYYKFYERNNWAQIVYNNQIVWVELSSLKSAENKK